MKKPLMMPVGEFGEIIHDLVYSYGGYQEFHTHIDRSGTLDPVVLENYRVNPLDVARLPLRVKQDIVGEVHRGVAFTKESLLRRMRYRLDVMRETGTTRVISFIDTTPDIGLRAIEIAVELRGEYLEKGLDFQIIPHPIFGFKKDSELDSKITRWDLFVEACSLSEVSGVGALPERDDRSDSIGSDEHFRRVLELGIKLGKPVHIHVGQANDPREKNIFDLIEAVRWIGSPSVSNIKEPSVWAVHNISASAFSEYEFQKMIDGQKRYNIGTVVCTRAALSMRQKRGVYAPIHNSVARVPEMLLAEIPVRLGNDNIADMVVPTGSGSLLNEALVLADTIRFYDPHVLAKIAAGKELNKTDLETVRAYLDQDLEVHCKDDPDFDPCVYQR